VIEIAFRDPSEFFRDSVDGLEADVVPGADVFATRVA
jgi:hypothetical protein